MSNLLPTMACRRIARTLAPAAVCALCISSLAFGESPAAEEFLATCELQQLSADSSPQSMVTFAGLPDRSPQPLDMYQRGFGSEWRVPAEVDPSDPKIRLLVLSPGGPVLLEVAIFIDGQSFRSIREGWIDGIVRGDDVEAIMAAQRGSMAPDPDAPQPPADAPPVDNQPQTPTAEEGDAVEDAADEESAPEEDDEALAEDAPEQEEQENQEEQPARVTAERYEAPGPLLRLKNYAATLDGPLDRSEARWLLAEWVPGPALLELRHGFGWERAGVAPLMQLWDEESDGVLTATEIDAARERLASCDIDEDDTVDLREIARSQSARPATYAWTPPRLIALLDQQTDWSALARDLSRAYPADAADTEPSRPMLKRLAKRLGVDAAAPLAPRDLEKTLDVPPDVMLQVCFGKSDSLPEGIVVASLDPELGPPEQMLAASKDVIVIGLEDSYIEVSAAGSSEFSGQVSCGAVVDGYPLMRHLDSDSDKRFSLREMQQVSEALAGFDRDDNGRIDATEIRTPIRLAFAQGPNVHAMLATPSGAAIREQSRPKRDAPIWFTPMDANSDGDVARAEFFGTDEQFRRLDADGDGLVSIAEAVAAEPDAAEPSQPQ